MHIPAELEYGPADAAGCLELLPAELQALTGWLQGQASPAHDLQWEQLRGLALVHGVAPLLHHAWQARSDVAPAVLVREFGELRRQNALLRVLAMRQRDEILQMLAQSDIPCLLLKGAALARPWYGDVSLRPYVDIDLLLPEPDIPRARDALKTLRYAESQYAAAPHHETPLERGGMPCALELHHGLTPLLPRHVLPFADLYGRSITLGCESGNVRTLGAEDTLLHLCLHVLTHVKITHGWRLSHLCDISRHLEVFSIDWGVFHERAEAVGVRRGCGAVLGLASVLAGARVPRSEIDEDATLVLARYPLPGPLDVHHHFLAAFVCAVARGNLGEALTLVLRSAVDWNHGGQLRIRDLQPGVLLRTSYRLARESLTHPQYLRSQLRLWVPEAEKLGARERAVAELLAQ